MAAASNELLKTPLHGLHLELGARMVPFAGYTMPVQYPAGLMAEHKHTRAAAGLFDISHMGQLRLVGPDAAAAFESLMPVDVIGLAPGKQRYGLLLNDQGGILDDLMFFNEGNDSLFVIVNGACKAADIAHIQARIGQRCQVQPMPDHALDKGNPGHDIGGLRVPISGTGRRSALARMLKARVGCARSRPVLYMAIENEIPAPSRRISRGLRA